MFFFFVSSKKNSDHDEPTLDQGVASNDRQRNFAPTFNKEQLEVQHHDLFWYTQIRMITPWLKCGSAMPYRTWLYFPWFSAYLNLSPWPVEISEKTQNLDLHCLPFSRGSWLKMKSFFIEDKDLFVLLSQYRGCWWPGDARSQGISSHGIDLVLSEYFSLSTRMTKNKNLPNTKAVKSGQVAILYTLTKFIWHLR